MNYKEEDKKYIEKSGRYIYYEFTNESIKGIATKSIKDVTGDEWRSLVQMLYPTNMIGSGFFQPILIFRIDRNGNRIDPPTEAFNSLDELKDGTCLLIRIIDFIKKNSDFTINPTWYKHKEKILEEIKEND